MLFALVRNKSQSLPGSEAVAAFGPPKPLAGAWFGKRLHAPLRKPPHVSEHGREGT